LSLRQPRCSNRGTRGSMNSFLKTCLASGASAVPRSFKIRSATAKVLTEEQGFAAVEFAMVAPLLILMLIGMIDLGVGLYRRMQVETASHAGAQYAAFGAFDATMVATAVTTATSYSKIAASPAPYTFCGCPSSAGVVTATCGGTCPEGSTPGTYAKVSAQASYTTLIPYPIIASSFNFSSQALVRIR
jgi:Flp pilus assembly protein TadG